MKIKFQYQLIFYYLIVVAVLSLVFSIFLLGRTQSNNINDIEEELFEYNYKIYNSYTQGIPFKNIELPEDVRVTIIDTAMVVIYDSNVWVIGDKEHADRPEIIESLQTGDGTAIRYSETIEADCIYYAIKYSDMFIRTSKLFEPEIPTIVDTADFQYIIVGLLIILIASIVIITNRLTKPLKAFTEFTDILLSDHNNKDFSSIKFPQNEFGDIGRKIIDTIDQLEKTKLYKQQMSHNIAHELKTPVTGIRGYLETILHEDSMDMIQIRRFADKAYAQTIRLTSLINDVSILNKIEEGAKQFSIEKINITDCINDILEELAYKLKANNSNLNLEFGAELVLYGDYSLIYSLFKNLIDNTIEHAGTGVNIEISADVVQKTADKGYHINFVYSDTGKGIPEESLNRIFERFYRIDKGRSRKNGGSGLGLSIVRNAVLFHKGNISVGNRPEGGIIFRFNLDSLER